MKVLVPGLLLVVAALSGCAADVDAEGNWLMIGATLPDGRWDSDNGGRYFLQIEGDAATGMSGCDAFRARVAQDGGDLSIEHVETSERPACPADVPEPLDGRLLSALRVIDSAQRDGDLLILRGDDTTLRLRSRG